MNFNGLIEHFTIGYTHKDIQKKDCKKYTMVTYEHLDFLENIITIINKENINGSIVECGVWKGGCCMWMLYCQKKYNMDRKIYLYDTFEGMTKPDSIKDDKKALEIYNNILNKNYNRGYDDWHKENKWAFAPIDYVKNNINYTHIGGFTDLEKYMRPTYNYTKLKGITKILVKNLNNIIDLLVSPQPKRRISSTLGFFLVRYTT